MFIRVTRLPSQTPVLLNLDHVEMFTTRFPSGAPQNARTVVFYVPRPTDDPEYKDRDYLAETLAEIEAATSRSAEQSFCHLAEIIKQKQYLKPLGQVLCMFLCVFFLQAGPKCSPIPTANSYRSGLTTCPRKRLRAVCPCSPWHRAMCPHGTRQRASQGLQTGPQHVAWLAGAGRPDFPAVAVLRVAAGATIRQACTAAGIDPDAPLVGIPAAAF